MFEDLYMELRVSHHHNQEIGVNAIFGHTDATTPFEERTFSENSNFLEFDCLFQLKSLRPNFDALDYALVKLWLRREVCRSARYKPRSRRHETKRRRVLCNSDALTG